MQIAVSRQRNTLSQTILQGLDHTLLRIVNEYYIPTIYEWDLRTASGDWKMSRAMKTAGYMEWIDGEHLSEINVVRA